MIELPVIGIPCLEEAREDQNLLRHLTKTNGSLFREAMFREQKTGEATMSSTNPISSSGEQLDRRDLVLIDDNVNDATSLLADMDSEIEVKHLTPGASLDDIADIVGAYEGLSGLHIISHGSAGTLALSGGDVDEISLSSYQEALSKIGAAIREDGDLILYGCHIGLGGQGQKFIEDIAALTGADVAASNDLTGSSSLGGNWSLETVTGNIDIPQTLILPLSTYRHTLAANSENFDTSGLVNEISSTSLIVGDWTFTSNVAVNMASANEPDGIPSNLDGLSDRSIKLNYSFAAGVTDYSVKSTDGTDFKLNSFSVGNLRSTIDDTVTIAGYRDGSPVTGASDTVDFTTSDSTGSITYTFGESNPTSGESGVVTFDGNWSNIDEIRFSFTTNGALDFDDLNVSPAVANNLPVLGGSPADETATEDTATPLDLSVYNLSDADGDTITITLAVDRGNIASTDGNGTTSGVTIAGSGSSSMTFQGTAANLNTYLNDTSKITFTTASNDTVAATLTVTPNDGSGDGSSDTISIGISAVNDDPTISGLVTDIALTEDTQDNIALGAASFADVDGDTITVTLTASAGTFATPADGAGNSVTETQVSGTEITLVGTAANINTYLDTASNIQYTPAVNTNGGDAATITVVANDGQGSGDVTLGTINLDITAVNDRPTITGVPSDITLTEDTSGNIDLSAVSVADAEGSNLTITLTASEGSFGTPADGAGIGSGVTETRVSDTVITLAGAAADINTYLDTASNITYTGASNDSGDDTATITIAGSDGVIGFASNPVVNLDITEVNDEPTLTATGNTATTPSRQPGTKLFSSVSIDAIEAGQNIASVTLTVTGLEPGASETLLLDGSDVVITSSAARTNTNIGSFSYEITSSGSSSTIILRGPDGGTATASVFATALDRMTYKNFTANPTLGDRVITITSMSDAGGTANGGDDTVALNIASTITIVEGDTPTACDATKGATEDTPFTMTTSEIVTAQEAAGVDALEYITLGTITGGSLALTGSPTAGTATDTSALAGAGALSSGDKINLADLTLIQFTPEENRTTDASVTYTVTDAGGDASSNATLTITFTPVNDSPTGTDKTINLTTGGTRSFSVADFGFNDVDTGDTLQSVTINTENIDNGTFRLSGIDVSAGDTIAAADITAGNLVYIPSGTGVDTFTFTVGDGVATDNSPKTITVNTTVTLTPTPSPAPSPTPTETETVDGVVVETITTTNGDGSTTTTRTIAPVSANRVEDAGTLNSDRADIPLQFGDTGGTQTQTIASLPVGVGATVKGSTTPASITIDSETGNPVHELLTLTDDTVSSSDNNKTNILSGATTFLKGLFNEGKSLVTNSISFTTTNEATITASSPITITGSSLETNSGTSESLVIDTTNLPTGSTLQLDEIEFAVIIGGANVSGGTGANLVYAGDGSQTIVLGEGDDVLYGGTGDDTVGSEGGDDQLFGNAGNDTLFGGAGADQLHGGADTDTVTYTGNRDDYRIAQVDSVVTVTLLSDESDVDTLINVENIQFADQTLSVSFGEELEILATLYNQVLGRQADLGGIQFWAGATAGNTRVSGDAVFSMLSASEVSTRLGSNLTDQTGNDAITILYEAILGRTADSSGLAYWTDLLESGLSIGHIAVAFATSAELSGMRLDSSQWDFIV